MTDKTKTNKTVTEQTVETAATMSVKVSEDLKHSVLIVSIVANLFVLTAWILLQVTTQYDAQIASFLFTR
jgi:hypothetical protein